MIETIITHLVFSLFPRYTPNYTFDENKLLENHKRFILIEVISILTLFIYVGLIVFITYSFADNLYESLIIFFSQYQYLYSYYAPKGFWLATGTLLGLATIVKPMEFVNKIILKDNYNYYIEWSNRKHNYDRLKIVRPITHFCAIVVILFLITAFDWYLKIDKEHIIINDFFSIKTREYKMSDIASISFYQKDKAPNGQINNFPHYRIDFKDGFNWTADALEIEEEKCKEIFKFLSAQSGIEIENKEIDGI